jgi:hypothetical protein
MKQATQSAGVPSEPTANDATKPARRMGQKHSAELTQATATDATKPAGRTRHKQPAELTQGTATPTPACTMRQTRTSCKAQLGDTPDTQKINNNNKKPKNSIVTQLSPETIPEEEEEEFADPHAINYSDEQHGIIEVDATAEVLDVEEDYDMESHP